MGFWSTESLQDLPRASSLHTRNPFDSTIKVQHLIAQCQEAHSF